jgi:hypothetical protein
MAELIKGDATKGIKNVGELALRISKFDSYRLFTLYENVKDRKVMDVSGNQKYYLVFKSPKKEIRIPEYNPKGFFEVDKVNGCILFKITKKNAEDILSMKTGGQRIFHIIRVFEETDDYGKVLSVTDEVEVYNGKWGDDEAFNTFSTENKVDLLTQALAAQIEKNANQLKDYNDLLEKYNDEVEKSSDLEKELEAMRLERDSLQTQLNEYLGDTHDGTLLSTDTKYIAFEDTLDNISFTEEQYSNAMNELMTKGEVDLTEVVDIDDPRINVHVKISDSSLTNAKIVVYKNDDSKGNAIYGREFGECYDAGSGDVFKFVCSGVTSGKTKTLYLEYDKTNNAFDGIVTIKKSPVKITNNGEFIVEAALNFYKEEELQDVIGNIGTLRCSIA